ncbi:MAG: radical SAM protein [Prevotella sp.]|nr:radical SAM protein [Prevotella sp.]MDY4038601.1 radical SAM protein [Prevotella sp.]
MKAPLMAIARHRIAIDGEGVTTLVAFHGCPVRCRYCLNSFCLRPEGLRRSMSPEEVLDEVKIDNLYFVATGGGVCFGGGEPLLRSGFICRFAEIMPPSWKLTVETSLNVPIRHLKAMQGIVSKYIVDIKDMNPDIYERYTGKDNRQVEDNLKWMASNGLSDQTLIRLPLIPGFNTKSDRDRSREQLREMKFVHFDEFTYLVPEGQHLAGRP